MITFYFQPSPLAGEGGSRFLRETDEESVSASPMFDNSRAEAAPSSVRRFAPSTFSREVRRLEKESRHHGR